MSKSKYRMGVTSGLRGYFAVLYDEGTGEPWQTGVGSYKSAKEASVEAQMWAEEEGVELDESVWVRDGRGDW